MAKKKIAATKIQIINDPDNSESKAVKVQLLNKGPNGGFSSQESEKVLERGQACTLMVHDRNSVRIEEIPNDEPS